MLRKSNYLNRSPKSIIRIGNSGLKCIIPFSKDPNKFAVTLKNGSIGLFDYSKAKIVFKTEPSHSETIFDMQIRACDHNTMATCSFDGTVKTWDMTTLKVKDSLLIFSPNEECKLGETDIKTVLYSISWSPKDNYIVVANGTALLQIWDIDKDKMLCQYQSPAKTPIYKVDWHPIEREYILYGNTKGEAIILKVGILSEGLKVDVYRKFNCNEAVFGVQWNPFNKDCFAAGCQDGNLRVFDISKKEDDVASIFKGHSLKIFNVLWHPHFENIIATSSDDKTVRVWDTQAVYK